MKTGTREPVAPQAFQDSPSGLFYLFGMAWRIDIVFNFANIGKLLLFYNKLKTLFFYLKRMENETESSCLFNGCFSWWNWNFGLRGM